MSLSVVVRRFESRDADGVGKLMACLGYPVINAETVFRRFAQLETGAPYAVFVAAHGDRVVGMLHAGYVPQLIADGYAEVLALVVEEQMQRQGIGRQLIAAAEVWAAECLGTARIRLRSGVHRLDAHKFYESMGYAAQRASYAFDKAVVPVTDERQ